MSDKKEKKYLRDNAQLMSEWDYEKNTSINPRTLTCGIKRKFWWKCDKDHEYQATINNRSRGSNCPYCANKKVVVGYNDLSTTHPEIACEWHPSKNLPNTPNQFSYGSKVKAWWLAKCGHEWEATICSRASTKRNCPICSNNQILTGFNDLQTKRPDIACEWHPTKNGQLKPSDVSQGSGKMIWWVCPKGHEYQSKINNRYTGYNCPICAHETQTSFPEQAILFYINKYFSGVINNYKLNYEVRSKNEIDIYIPSIKTGIEYDGVVWHRSKENIEKDERKNKLLFEQGIKLIRIREQGCPTINMYGHKYILCDTKYRVGQYGSLEKAILILFELLGVSSQHPIDIQSDRLHIISTFQKADRIKSISSIAPEMLNEWHPTKNGSLNPKSISATSNVKVWWMCEKNHDWEESALTRIQQKTGCPFCSNHRVWVGFNDLLTTQPEIATEWHPTKNGSLLPNSLTYGSATRVWWQCSFGHEWVASVHDRCTDKTGCPFCSNRRIIIGFNDLKTTNPILAKQWHPTLNYPYLPEQFSEGSGKSVWWYCSECKYTWQTKINDRKGRGCPCCSNKIVKVGYNDLFTTNPCLASEWHPTKNGSLKPEDVVEGSNKRVWWLCANGHEWQAKVNDRKNGRGCLTCYKNSRLINKSKI